MSEKKAAPKATENNDDLLGGAENPQDAPKQDAPKQDAPKQDAPKQDAPKTAKKSTAKKPSASEAKKIKAAQGSDDNDYLPNEKERHLFHVKMEKRVFSPSTGKKLTKDYIQMYSVKEWKAFEKNGKGLGYTCTVLWNPENYK